MGEKKIILCSAKALQINNAWLSEQICIGQPVTKTCQSIRKDFPLIRKENWIIMYHHTFGISLVGSTLLLSETMISVATLCRYQGADPALKFGGPFMIGNCGGLKVKWIFS